KSPRFWGRRMARPPCVVVCPLGMVPFRNSLTIAATGSGSPALLRTFTTIVALLPPLALCSLTPSWHRPWDAANERLISKGRTTPDVRNPPLHLVELIEGQPLPRASLDPLPHQRQAKHRMVGCAETGNACYSMA